LDNKKDVTSDVIDAINITILCQEMHSLPHDGGILDQDQLIMRKMNIVLSAQAEKHELEKEQKDRKK